jgi:hypothetical protein
VRRGCEEDYAPAFDQMLTKIAGRLGTTLPPTP